MQNKLLVKKLKEFKKHIKHFLIHEKHDVKSIHDLRVHSREISSLISVKDSFYTQVKKIIKLSNKIRDIDVFLEVYLESLPKKQRSQLKLKDIKNSIQKKRKKKKDQLNVYLQSLVIPSSAAINEMIYQSSSCMHKKAPLLEQSELHKYRIYIKKRLYIEKNSTPINKSKIKALTKIKNLLGTINDNYNGLKSLSQFAIKPKLYKQIQDYTEKENLKIYIDFKELDVYSKICIFEN